MVIEQQAEEQTALHAVVAIEVMEDTHHHTHLAPIQVQVIVVEAVEVATATAQVIANQDGHLQVQL